MVSLANKFRIDLKESDISVCHRLPTHKDGPRPIIAKFVRRETKLSIMARKKMLRDQQNNIFLNDDLTPLRGKLAFALRRRDDVKFVNFLNENLIVIDNNDKKYIFKSLCELYKWDSEFISNICANYLN